MIPELNTLAEARILVVGDLMLDEYFYGDIERRRLRFRWCRGVTTRCESEGQGVW